jgi:carbonic anhydrase
MFDQILQSLREGNQRFVLNQPTQDYSPSRRKAVAQEQRPCAAILSCIDSRIPSEIIFDQGLGDLLVVRSAGQVVDRAVQGSLELAVAVFHVPVIVVLGHKRCGAVGLALDSLQRGEPPPSEIAYLEQSLRPAVESAREIGGDVWNHAARMHTELTVQKLKQSPILGAAVMSGKLKIVGGWYDLDSGLVELNYE